MAQDTPIWQRDVYDTLASALGAPSVAGIARRFRDDLRTRFVDPTSREGLGRDAHAIVSAAGMLGFVGLADAAQALEQACAGDADLAQPLTVLLSARQAAERCLDDPLPGDPPQAPRAFPDPP